ncbi:MAG: energy transducer TonB [Candidatus Kapaibacterium sp.]|jgi:protein TonB
MSTTAVVEAPRSPYGAKELKEWIGKNTYRSFIISLSILLLFALVSFVYNYLKQRSLALKSAIPVVKINLSDLPPPPSADAPPPPPPGTVSAPTVAGTPIPVPETMLTPDTKDFASLDEMKSAPAVATEGNGSIEVAIDAGTQVVREAEPAPDEFVSVEKEPNTDLAEVQRKLVYPPMAIKQGLEGKVLVRVLVGKDGRPKRSIIDQSVASSLDEAAMRAVMSSYFTPAIQNNTPIDCWVTIPVVFKLR